MPTYVFACPTCNEDKELIMSSADRDNPQTCDVCSGKMKRAWSFSGSVWAPTSTSGGHK